MTDHKEHKELDPQVCAPIFKGGNGSYLTKQLFYETADTSRPGIIYTLKDEDYQPEGYPLLPSIRRLFVETEDLTEYSFAITYLGGWRHYQRLLECTWFEPVIQEARQELSVRLAAQNLSVILQKAHEGDVKANQYLLERKWIPQESKSQPVGRPSKEKIKREAELLFQSRQTVEDDLSRILSGSNPGGIQ